MACSSLVFRPEATNSSKIYIHTYNKRPPPTLYDAPNASRLHPWLATWKTSRARSPSENGALCPQASGSSWPTLPRPPEACAWTMLPGSALGVPGRGRSAARSSSSSSMLSPPPPPPWASGSLGVLLLVGDFMERTTR